MKRKRFFNESFKKSQRYKAFTLAEVLITLGIIGIVAALTIPSLIANYQETQQIAGFKKAYAEITEALKLMANDYGCPEDLSCTGAFKGSGSFTSGDTTLGNIFKKYFKLAKDCGATYKANDKNTQCLAYSVSNNYDGSGQRYDMNTDDFGNGGTYTFITTDGFAISLINYGSNCKEGAAVNQGKYNYNTSFVCGYLQVDINNFKGPNNIGGDIFDFYITNGKGPALYPQGGSEILPSENSWIAADGTPQACNGAHIDGSYCAGRLMEQGWQMKYLDEKITGGGKGGGG